jgi:hypothetical protein
MFATKSSPRFDPLSFSAGFLTDPRAAVRCTEQKLTLADLRIRTKDKRIIGFAPNPVQVLYLDQLCPRWRAGDYKLQATKEIILKARQFGFSTLILGLFFLDTISTPNTSTVVIAHDGESTERLFRMVHRFYLSLPETTRPRTKFANRREYLWPDLDSSFFVGTAGAKDFGRSSTINNVHMSEVGMWKNGEELVSGLLQAVPAGGNVFAESTAKGLGNWFHSEYTAAERGDSVFVPRFFGWHQHEEYRSAPGPGFTPTPDEEKLIAAYRVTPEQLAWRRTKILELRDLFPQEYPANAREAFLTSGNPYFDRAKLSELSDALHGPEHRPLKPEIPVAYPLLRREPKLTIWKAPAPGRRYVIGADTAEGLPDKGKDADFDSADVFDAETWEQVARLHGQWDTHQYGLLLAELGTWYNLALLGIERNNHGHAVINAAMHTAGYPVQKPGQGSGLYCHEEFDEKKTVTARRPGWPTTAKTKFFALDGLATSIDEDALKLHSPQTVSELLTFVKLPGGKAGGEGKCHDDAVMSCAIADALLKMRLSAPRKIWAK